MDKQELGQRLRTLRAADGRTVASVATQAGLSVPYVANLENGRGNPTMDVLTRLGEALGARVSIEFGGDDTVANAAPVLPASLVRFGRGARFRRDVQLCAEALAEDPAVLAARLLDALAGVGAIAARDLAEPDWGRLLDAVLLVVLHPQAGRAPWHTRSATADRDGDAGADHHT